MMVGLMGISEMARATGVAPSAVTNWRRRHDDFPGEVMRFGNGPLYKTVEFKAWAKVHGKRLLGAEQMASPRRARSVRVL